MPVYIAWCGTIAHFWVWIRDQAQDQAIAAGRWLPESVLLPPPAADGARLLHSLRGYEGQVWQAGSLAASQWWQEAPALDVWQRFLRGAGVASIPMQVPAAERLEWSDKPWGKAQHSALDTAARERIAWAALLLLGMAAFGWQVVGLQRWAAAQRSMAAQLDASRAKAAPVLAARDAAEAARAEIAQLQGLDDGVNDYVLMADVAAALPAGSQFVVWRREPGKLRMNVRNVDTDPRTFINAFSSIPQLATVTATPLEGGVMQLEFALSSDEATAEDAR